MVEREDINVIVPFGFSEVQPERENLLHFIVEECIGGQTYPNVRTVLVESSEKPTQEEYAKAYCDEYHFIPLDNQIFSPGMVQNEGYLRAKGARYTYIHQADFLLPRQMIEEALEQMKDIHAPFIFPFFSSINLSKPLTEALLNDSLRWTRLISVLEEVNARVRAETHQKGIVPRKYLGPEDINRLEEILTPELQVTALLRLTPKEVWGEDDGTFTYFGDSFRVVQPSETLIKYRPGGRAKASYLALSSAYDKVGGPPNYIGWGYEDLGLWARVQAFYNYERRSDGDMYYNGHSVSSNYPIVHLWHSTTNRQDYFGLMEHNRKLHEEFLSMPDEDKRQSIVPLGKKLN